MSLAGFRPHHGALLIALAGVLAFVAWRGRTARDDPATVLAALRAAAGPALPTPASVGASMWTEPTRYTAETLYEFIDGAAEGYLGRGFTQALATTYTFTAGEGSIEIAAEVHRFAAPAGAAAQLEAEKPSAAVPVSGLLNCWGDASMLQAVLAAEYLKLTALGTNPEAANKMKTIAAAWTKGHATTARPQGEPR